MKNKFENLKKYLSELGKHGICLAFSGGIDSTLLLYLCKDFNTVAVTFSSVFQTEEELELSENLCKKYSVRYNVINFFPLEDKILVNNPKDRCYHCKKLFFGNLKDFAKENNLKFIIDGTNADDIHTYRPGLRALEEMEIISPFVKFQITKQEIRDYAKEFGIEIFNKPSTPCLATRFPYGTELNERSLNIVRCGERFLKEIGFENNRFRLHNDIARIEIPKEQFEDFLAKKEEITKYIKHFGVKYVTLDMEGIRSGSMDL